MPARHPDNDGIPQEPAWFSMRSVWGLIWVWACVALGPCAVAGEVMVGAARVDITPSTPIRLAGYVARKTESTGAHGKLWAKALAIGSGSKAVVWVTVDNCGVCSNVTEEVARRLERKRGLARARVVISSTHTHSAPWIVGFAPNIFAEDLPESQVASVERYTREVTDAVERVALGALEDRRPLRLSWMQGAVGFAANRRTAGGPVDHSVPVLVARERSGAVRAVLANYACHCTTLGAGFNQTCGDWAGFAQEALETRYAGAVAMVSVGCGADSNPNPRGGADHGLGYSMRYGQTLAAEVERLVGGKGVDLSGPPRCEFRTLDLPFQPHFTREQWETRSTQPGIVGYHARRNLGRLERGESLPRALKFPVQTWQFGDRLAVVFLGGEVVVDYALRFKRELKAEKLWITAYANDVPCYIPSKRVLAEGGYEALDSLWYYDRPAPLGPEIEDLIVGGVQGMVSSRYRVKAGGR